MEQSNSDRASTRYCLVREDTRQVHVVRPSRQERLELERVEAELEEAKTFRMAAQSQLLTAQLQLKYAAERVIRLRALLSQLGGERG